MKTTLITFIILSFTSQLHAGDREISDKLDSLAKSLIGNYTTRYPDERTITLAVLPFHTSADLAKRRVGIALAELLTHSFSRYPYIKPVERLELDKIFTELKLSMSGVAELEDALRVGKLANAKLQVFGSIEKIGGKYHVNARAVRTETGEIAATAYETLSADAFEENAKIYLIPVPETQALGFYFFYNLRHVPAASGPYSYPTGGGGTETVSPCSFSMKQLGAGLRYSPAKRLQIDFAAIYSGNTANLGATSRTVYAPLSWDNDLTFGAVAYRALFNYNTPLNRILHVYSGAGMIWHQLYGEMNGSYSSPLIHSRIEFKPQSRIALNIAVNYEFKQAAWRAEYGYGNPLSPTHKPDKLSIEPSIGFYF